MYNVVDSMEGENQRHKSDIGPYPDTPMDAAAATAAHNVPVNKTTSRLLPENRQNEPGKAEHQFES